MANVIAVLGNIERDMKVARAASKPHIRWSRLMYAYVCGDVVSIACGKTPVDAYINWMNDMSASMALWNAEGAPGKTIKIRRPENFVREH